MCDLAEAIDHLLNATAQISAPYFMLPIANENGDAERIFRERVYCYELYHQWRSLWGADSRYSLGGEIDKIGHPIIRGNYKPDFLVHIPGEMENLLVVEVKPSDSSPRSIANDLIKLCKFRRNPIDYKAAIMLIYGLKLEQWAPLRGQLRNELRARAEFDERLVQCVAHRAPGERADILLWEEP